MKLVFGGLVVGVLVAGAASAGAQSLADVARQEEARREKIAKPSKVYTDADVQKYAPATPGAQASATTVTALDANGKPMGEQAVAEGLPADEAGWRARLQNARDGMDRNRLLLGALEQQARSAARRAGTAEGDAPADDSSTRAAEIKRLKAEMDTFRATLANAEEDARKAGVPPGWVR
jgi:hypothetical protein